MGARVLLEPSLNFFMSLVDHAAATVEPSETAESMEGAPVDGPSLAALVRYL